MRTFPPSRQSGAVLAFGLVILLILTLLGVTAMRTSMLEEHMTGNIQDGTVALQAAEAALRNAESDLQVPVLPQFDGTSGRYPNNTTPASPRWKVAANWTGSASTVYNGFAGAAAPLNKVTARYFIEELPLVYIPGESLASDQPLDEIGFYRITSRAIGVGGTAMAMLQTTFRR
jgi:type IV pilus assembly protein PilX